MIPKLEFIEMLPWLQIDGYEKYQLWKRGDWYFVEGKYLRSSEILNRKDKIGLAVIQFWPGLASFSFTSKH